MTEIKRPERGYVESYNEALSELEANFHDPDDINFIAKDPDPPEPVEPQEAPPAEPESVPSPDPVDEIPDWKAALEAERAERRVWEAQLQRHLQSLQVQPQPTQQAPSPIQQQLQYEDPLLAQLQQVGQHTQFLHNELKSLKTQEAERDYKEALGKLSQKYPDLHTFVPAQILEHVKNEELRKGNFGIRWEQEIEKEYRNRSWEAVSKRAAQRDDEVSAKREEKRAKSTVAAANVPSGGAAFQKPPVASQPTKDIGYRNAKAAMSAELEMLSG